MEKQSSKLFNIFLRIGHLEGLSYLLLLCVAMPMKYWFALPMAVKLVGSLHGILFVAYCILLVLVMIKMKWSLLKGFCAFGLSLIPLGTFWLHKLK